MLKFNSTQIITHLTIKSLYGAYIASGEVLEGSHKIGKLIQILPFQTFYKLTNLASNKTENICQI